MATNTEVDAVSSATSYGNHDCEQHHGQHGGQSRENMMQQFFDELGLSGQQQADIQIITSDYAERFRDLAKLGRATAEELMNLAPDDPSYRDKTDEASALAASSAAEMVVLLAEMRAKLYAVLTDDQRARLKEKIEQKKLELEEKKLQRQQDTESHDRPFEQFIG
ncbi:MAG: periplasmic heavy metal sensor [Gammaproteobacteria bacterium]|nr:periplasmic heavy metal sensor [Gammaproteobacteria bacterium]